MTTNKEKFSFIIKKDKKIKDNQIHHPPNTEISDKGKASMHNKKNCMTHQYNDYSFEDKMKPSMNNVLMNNNLNSETAINQKDELANSRKSNLNSNDYDQQLVNTNISEYSDSNSVKSQPNQSNLSNAYFLHENAIRDKDNAMSFNTNNLQISNNFLNSMNQKVQSNKHIMGDLNNKEQQGLKPSSAKEDNSKGMINDISRNNQLTDEEVLRDYEIKTNSNIKSFMFFINNLHSIELKLKTKENELTSCIHQHEKLLQEQNHAIELNNFQKADLIETNINQISETITSLNKSITSLTKEFISAKKEEFAFKKQYSTELNYVLSNYEKLKRVRESTMESFISKEIAEHNKEKHRVNKLKEKLYFIKGNIEAEDSYIKEEEDKIARAIQNQASDLLNELEQYNQVKEAIIDEIKELQRKLEEKQEELEKVNSNIEIKEKDIDAIKANYSQEFSRINIKTRNFKENLKDYEEQEQNYELKKKHLENREIDYDNKLNQMKERIHEYNNIIQSLNEDKIKQNEDLSLKEQLVNKEHGLFEDVNTIANDIDDKQKIMKEQNSNIQQFRVDIKVLESEIKQIEIKIPPLEEEKKTFVKGKNFKEAGRVSNEIKRLNEQKNNNQKTIEESNTKLSNNEIYVNDISNQIRILINEKGVKERELKKVRYEYLTCLNNTLNSYQRKVVENNNIDNIIQFIQEEIESFEKYNNTIDSTDNVQCKVNGQDSPLNINKLKSV